MYTVAITETEKTQINCIKYVVITLGQTETDNINLMIVLSKFATHRTFFTDSYLESGPI